MNTMVLIIFAIVGALIIGTWTQLRVGKSVQAARLQLAEDGERFLARTDISKKMRSQVQFYLDTAFGFTGVMLVAIVIFPVAAIVMACFSNRLRRGSAADQSIPREIRAEFIELMKLHDQITLANHPVLHTLYKTEVAIMSPICLLIRGLCSKAIPEQLDGSSFLAAVEMREAKLLRFMHP